MKTVCIICGGQSHEHEISLLSAASVLDNIDREKYNVKLIVIDVEGRMFYCDAPKGVKLAENGWKTLEMSDAFIVPDKRYGGIFYKSGETLEFVKIDVFFPVLHGENGEDGVIQGLLKMTGIPYVGSGVLASASCMDKEITHIRLEAVGIKTAPYIIATVFDLFSEIKEKAEQKLGYPMFVKPANAGSSFGVNRADNAVGLKDALETAFEVDKKVLIEKCIVGKEVESAVMGNDDISVADVVGEIAPTVEFYDFNAKYTDSSTQLFIPARIDDAVSEKIRRTAEKAYKALGCQGLSRVDFFVLDDGEIILNEINNIPGFTSISMFPKLFGKSGIGYGELIDKLIETAEVK